MFSNTPRSTPTTSLLDSKEFNSRLFFPRQSDSPAPEGAIDSFVKVPGATVHMRLFRDAGAKGTVLLFHGNGEVVSDYDHAAPNYHAIGLNLLVSDFRGYGKSTGTPTLRNAIEDSAVVFEHGRSLLEAGPLYVMGRSLGSACAVHLLATLPAGEVDGFIIESGFSQMTNLIKRRGMEPQPGVAADHFFDPIPKYQRAEAPLLLLHGDRDVVIAPSEAQAAFQASISPHKELRLIEGRGHNDIFQSPGYWASLKDFTERHSHKAP